MSDLFERAWPVQNAKAAVEIVHGLGEHSGRYEYVANALNAAGYSVHAQDVRGHGQSAGFPGQMGSADQIVADTISHLKATAAAYEKTFLLGHSMGSIIALATAAGAPQGTIAGLILSGCPLVPGEAVMTAMADPDNFVLPPETVSRDPEIVQAYADDPLVFHDPLPAESLGTLLEGSAKGAEAIAKITVPTLVVHGSQDKLASEEGARQLQEQLVVTDKTLKIYPGLYHEVLNEPERDEVIAYIVEWLDAH